MEKYRPDAVTNQEHILVYYLSEILEQAKETNRLLNTLVSKPKTTRKKKGDEEK